jgi:hypothetical protein
LPKYVEAVVRLKDVYIAVIELVSGSGSVVGPYFGGSTVAGYQGYLSLSSDGGNGTPMTGNFEFTFGFVPTPEPSALLLAGSGLAALLYKRRSNRS